MKFTVLFFLMVFLVLMVTACDPGRVMDENMPVPDEGWNKDQKASFEVHISDTTANYRFFINLRNSVDYRYSNFYLFLNTRFPNGNVTRDTIECLLADPSGEWLGRGNGKLRENQILLNPSLRFPLKGTYHFEVEQAMRDEVLKGITDIGIRIQKES
jgi:gliding motility-associated lipoprotein GldH